MIEIPRQIIRRLRLVFRKTCGPGRPGAAVAVFSADSSGLRLGCRGFSAAVEYHIEGEYPSETLAPPFDALADFKGRDNSCVQLRNENENVVVAEWTDGGVPQRRTYDTANFATDALPTPKKFENFADTSILSALETASQCAAREETRYALATVQLRGDQGQIVATDGKQAVILGGFEFPWTENLLIAASPVFGMKDFAQAESVGVGKTDDHVVFSIGPWKLWFKIQEGRFPRIEDAIPDPKAAKTKLYLDPEDARFLAGAISKLPGGKDVNAPVTVDLNGEVVVRAQAEGEDHATELVLSRSRIEGAEVRFGSDRQFVRRAAELGFTELHVTGDKKAVLCTDAARMFFWMPLSGESNEKPASHVTRIESATNEKPQPVSQPIPQPKRSTKTMPRTNTNGTNGSETNGNLVGDPTAELIEQAEKVKETLKEGIIKVNDLVTSLKQQKKQTKAVQSTLASLRQLVT